MENTEIKNRLLYAHQLMKNAVTFLQGSYNLRSKSFIEMNNTLNWANTVIVAIFIFYGKYLLDNKLNSIVDNALFIISTLVFLLLILNFALFKIKFISFENKTMQLLNELIKDLNLNELRLNFPDFYKDEGKIMNDDFEASMKRRIKAIGDIEKQLNKYFKYAIFTFVFILALIPSYFIVKTYF